MKRYCSKCAKPLKDKQVPKGGKVITVQVCKSPICPSYGKSQ